MARYKGKVVGGLGKIATFSFYGNKTITSGEGGAVTTNDPDLEYRMRILRGQGMDPQRRYFFPVVGYNYRLTNVACAILCAQLERYQSILQRRREIFATYSRLLSGIPGIGLQPVAEWAEISPWLFCITVDAAEYGHTRDELMAHLASKGIETRPFFIPLHSLPPYRAGSKARGEHLPLTDYLAASGINLPTYNQLGDEDIAYIAQAIAQWAK
jgi:perosamine synthetase